MDELLFHRVEQLLACGGNAGVRARVGRSSSEQDAEKTF